MDRFNAILVGLFCLPIVGYAQQTDVIGPLQQKQARSQASAITIDSAQLNKRPRRQVFDASPMPNLYRGSYAVDMPNAYRGDHCVPMPNVYQERPNRLIIPNRSVLKVDTLRSKWLDGLPPTGGPAKSKNKFPKEQENF